jgi:hypothetical protein
MASPLTEDHGLVLSRAAVTSSDGHDLGPVVDLYFDDRTGRPTWAAVRVVPTTPDAPALALVPLVGATCARGVVRVDVTAAQVAGAPACRTCDRVDVADEERLYRHYGLRPPAPPLVPPAARTGEHDDDATDGAPGPALAPGPDQPEPV